VFLIEKTGTNGWMDKEMSADPSQQWTFAFQELTFLLL
jgi:hypothetical protein